MTVFGGAKTGSRQMFVAVFSLLCYNYLDV